MTKRGGTSTHWLWAICAAQVPMMFVYANYVAALPLFKAEWNLTNVQAGTIYTAFYVGYILAAAVLATATDYMSAKKIYLASSLWLVLLNFMFPLLADGFISASVFRGLTGVGLAGTYAPALRLVAEYAPEGRRARMVGVYTFFYTVGVATSIYVTGALVANFEWRTAFALTSLGPAIGFLAMMFFLPPLPSPRGDGDAGFEFPRLPAPVWVLMGVVGAHRWEVFAFRGWIVTFLAASLVAAGTETRESALQVASSSAALIIGLSAVSKLIGGWFADRIGRPPTIIASLFLSGLISVSIGLAFGASFVTLQILCLIWVIVMHVDAPVLVVLTTELTPRRHLGSALGIQSGLGFLLGSLAPMVVGKFLDMSNDSTGGALPVNWDWAFIGPGVAAILGAVATVFVARRFIAGEKPEEGEAQVSRP